MTVQEAVNYLEKLPIDTKIGNLNKPTSSNLINMCMEALEKQIPKVPCYSGDGYYAGEMVIDTWECPCCSKQYEVDYEDYKYCPNCGQHIDHSTLTEDD